jgi:hypothetical protein
MSVHYYGEQHWTCWEIKAYISSRYVGRFHELSIRYEKVTDLQWTTVEKMGGMCFIILLQLIHEKSCYPSAKMTVVHNFVDQSLIRS